MDEVAPAVETDDDRPADRDAITDFGNDFQFDEATTSVFSDMISRSIPHYDGFRRFMKEAALYKLKQFAAAGLVPRVVDLGASRGDGLTPLIDAFGARGRYSAVEISQPMLYALRERFSGYIDAGVIEVVEADLRAGWPNGIPHAHVVQAAWTIQFVPIEYRQTLLREICNMLMPGGLFILAEKVLGATAELQELEVDVYLDEKQQVGGYTRDQVDRKRLALEGVLVPLPARFNEELILSAGFAAVDCVMAWGPFRGWLAVKR